MAIGKKFDVLEKNIDYKFKDPSYLENALTHSSYSNEYKSKGLSIPSNERLEFLGDAVLQMAISEYLYENFKSLGEGKLTRIRQQLVCERTLADVAARISLGQYVHLGRGEEADCRTRPKVLADTLEAVIAAIYVDSKASDPTAMHRVIVRLFSYELSNISKIAAPDYKTMLQQFIEKDGTAELEYTVTNVRGPEHKKEFTVVAKVNNNTVGVGTASTKKDAEMKAARKALLLFGFKL